MRVIRCLKAGDFCACQPRLHCLTTPLAIRDGRDAKVLPYATEWGCASASLSASRYYSATPCGKPAFLRPTRMHPSHSPAIPNNQTQLTDPRLEGGEKGTPAAGLSFLKPEIMIAFRVHIPFKFRASRLIDGLQVERAKPLPLACCNRLTVTQSALEGQYFCENFGYRRCRLCRWNSCHFASRLRVTSRQCLTTSAMPAAGWFRQGLNSSKATSRTVV